MKRTYWAFAVLFFGQLATAVAGEITVKGSDTMVILSQRWAESFMKQAAGVNIQVTGGGSGTGIAALRNNSTDIATASRSMKPKETADLIASHGQKPLEIKTALDGLSVYVHESNPMKEISFAQLDRIFRGQARNWSEFGGPDRAIVIYSRENNSGTYSYFKEHVLKEQDFSARALTMVGTAALINAVSKDPTAIGYGGIGYASGVKSLMVKEKDTDEACLPTDENVISGKYPLSRYLFFYLMPGSMTGDVKRFVEWVTSPAGQQVVSAAGYIPLPSARTAPAVANVPVVATPAKVLAAPPNPGATAAVSTPAPVAAPATSVVAPVAANVPVQPAPAQPVQNNYQGGYQPQPAYQAQPAYNPAAAIESLLEQSASLGKREAMLAGREETLASRETRLADREARLSGKESEVGIREAGLVSREKDLAAKEKELMRIEDDLNRGKRDSNRSNLFRR